MSPTDRDQRPETQWDVHRPKRHPRPREARSQKAQLDSPERHGESKDVKGPAARNAVQRPEGKNKDDSKTGLSVQVQRVLDEDKDLSSYDLVADVTSDGVARITGIVDSLREKLRASELVSAVPGVNRVENSISISTDGRITDAGVEMEVAEEIALDGRTKMIPEIRVERGHVILSGTVSSEEEKRAMIEAASKARGVTNITDNLRIDQGEIDWNDPRAIIDSQARNERG